VRGIWEFENYSNAFHLDFQAETWTTRKTTDSSLGFENWGEPRKEQSVIGGKRRPLRAMSRASEQWKLKKQLQKARKELQANQGRRNLDVAMSMGLYQSQHEQHLPIQQQQYPQYPYFFNQHQHFGGLTSSEHPHHQNQAPAPGTQTLQHYDEHENDAQDDGDRFPMKADGNFNMSAMLVQKIRFSDYFKKVQKLTTFEQVIDEIYYKVDSLDVWQTPKAKGGTPSTGFCLLLRLFELNLTKTQVQKLLDHPDSPYIRALGFLFLRFTCRSHDLWNWVSAYLLDEEPLKVKKDDEAETALGDWLEDLILAKRFHTHLPRLPENLHVDLAVQIMKARAEKKRLGINRERQEVFQKGKNVKAKYSRDGIWYDAVILGPGTLDGFVTVRYTEYGNEEEVSLGAVKDMAEPSSHRPLADEQDEGTLKKLVAERDHNRHVRDPRKKPSSKRHYENVASKEDDNCKRQKTTDGEQPEATELPKKKEKEIDEETKARRKAEMERLQARYNS